MPKSSPIWRPYTQEKVARASTKISRAEGSYLFTDSGRKIFDGISSWWLNTHGHSHPAIVDAIQKQAAKFQQVTFADFTHEPAEELCENLLRALPASLKRIFFSDNGSTAVEVAMKMALQACAQTGRAGKTKFLAFEKSYHGDTVGAMSLSGPQEYSAPYKATLFEVLRAKQKCELLAPIEAYLESFENLLEQNHSVLAAVIVEPLIQGAGGMIFWPSKALERIARKCREFGVYLIFDEVMTGFGRTGKLFALDHIADKPDIICLSKGLTGGSLPLALTVTTDEIYDAFYGEARSKMLFHGHSFTGNAISCAAANASLKLSLNSNFSRSLSRISVAQASGLAKLSGIANPRVCGTVAAFELADTENAKRVVETAFANGLFLRPLGATIYLMPPYSSSDSDLAQAWEILDKAIQQNQLQAAPPPQTIAPSGP